MKEGKCISSLFQSSDKIQWAEYLSLYNNCIEAVATKKKKPNLIQLDEFVQHEFARFVSSRHPHFITLPELSRIMEWKLLRGKMRPLQNLLNTNSPGEVQKVSEQALLHANKGQWKLAIEKLAQLKAVGPATASAVLAPLYPHLLPFMSDEAMSAALQGRVEYTMAAYTALRGQLVEKVAALGEPWTVEAVGKALWAEQISLQLHVQRVVPSSSAIAVDADPSELLTSVTSVKNKEVTTVEVVDSENNNEAPTKNVVSETTSAVDLHKRKRRKNQ